MSRSTFAIRRDLLKLSALFTAAGALTPLHALQAQSAVNGPVKIGYLPITDATPLLVAHANGYFEAEGLEAEKPVLLRSWAQMLEAFLSGQVNVVHLLTPMTVWARYGSKAPAKVVAWNHMSGSALTVTPSVNSLQDLGGTTVAIPFHYSVHNVVLQHMLRQAGLRVTLGNKKLAADEVRLVVMAPADMTPALASQRISAFIVAEPFNAQAELLQVGKILRFTGDVWRDHACCVLTMHERDLEQRPEWSQGVVNAIVKAQHWAQDHRLETAELMAATGKHRYTPHSVETLNKVLAPSPAEQAAYVNSGVIQHPEWNDKRIHFQPYPYPSYTRILVEQLQQMQFDQAPTFLEGLDPNWVASDLVDERFVKNAIAQLGGLSAFGQADRYEREEWLV